MPMKRDPLQTLTRELILARKRRKVTIEDLAKMTGIAKVQLERMDNAANGKPDAATDMRLSSLTKITSALNATVTTKTTKHGLTYEVRTT